MSKATNEEQKRRERDLNPRDPCRSQAYPELIPGLRPSRLGDPGSIGSSNHFYILINQKQFERNADNNSAHWLQTNVILKVGQSNLWYETLTRSYD